MEMFKNIGNGRWATAMFVGLLSACGSAPEKQPEAAVEQTRPVTIATPQSIAEEHHELHGILASATQESGTLGSAARELESVLGPHFEREEQIATPPLALLPALARGPVTADMASVLSMTDALESELPQMLREHEGIKAATAAFRAAAEQAGNAEYVLCGWLPRCKW